MVKNMANIYELYPRANDTINSSDLAEMDMPLTIKSVEILGESKKTVKITFNETPLKFKCNKPMVLELVELFETNDTDEFVGKELSLKSEDGKVKIEV